MITIIKVGGAIIEEETSLNQLLAEFTKIEGRKLLVHGGGRSSSELMKKLGIEPKMIDGRRVTDKKTLEIVTMVYAGINKKIVAKLQAKNVNAIGLCGADGNILKANKRSPEPIDFGYVGDVYKNRVDYSLLGHMMTQGLVPVFAPLTHDGKGSLLNTNADTIASVLAQALQFVNEVRLLYVFEKPGLLRNAQDDCSLIEQFTLTDYEEAKSQGFIHSGMHPKLKNAFDAVKNGVEVALCNVENMASLVKCTRIK